MPNSPKFISEESIYKAIMLLKVSMGYLLFVIEISAASHTIPFKNCKGILKVNSNRKIGCISLLSAKRSKAYLNESILQSQLFFPPPLVLLLDLPAAFNKLSTKAFSRLNYKMSDHLLRVSFSNF